MTKPERLLWWALKNNRAGLRFRKQHPAGCYVLDFYCESAKLCIEIDGETHDFTALRDSRRDSWLSALGIRTVRIPVQEVLRNLDAVVEYVLQMAQTPSASLRSSPPPVGEGR